MGALDFLHIAFHDDPTVRRDKFTNAYRHMQVDGLHYLVSLEGGAVALRRPDHTLHQEISRFLSVLRRRSRNTRNRYAQALKKFADFCLLWGVELGGPIPLEPMLRGFAEYVKVLHPKPPIRHRLDWVTIRKPPLHPVFSSGISQLTVRERDGVVVTGMSRSQIYDCLGFTLAYLRWLARADGPCPQLGQEIARLPTKTVTNRRGLIAGTAGPIVRAVTDVAELAGVFHPELEPNVLRPDSILTDSEVAELYRAADSSQSGTYRDQVILAMMEGFGIRRTALVNIQLKPESLPETAQVIAEGTDGLRGRLKGDLEWVRYPSGHRWVLNVRPHKGRPSYPVTYEFDQGPFTQALFLWLVERQAIMATSGQPDHGYLFIGLSRTSRAKPLREGAINRLFTRLLQRVQETTGRDLRQERTHATPHGMRHKFVTHELTVAGRSVSEVQKRVGHSVGGGTLVNTYYHWVQNRRTIPEQAQSLQSILELWRDLDTKLRGDDR